MKLAERNTTRTVAVNSFWYAFESVFSLILVFATSIPIARVLGPERLGYFNYVMWLVNIGALVGIGNPSVTHKYMAEYLGRGEGGIVRSIFYRTLRAQVITAVVITLAGEIAVFTISDPQYRLVSFFQVLSILPAMINGIPSQANNAIVNMKANVAGGLSSAGIYLAGVVLSLTFGWDLLGIAIAFLVSRSAELLIRIIPVIRWVNVYEIAPVPSELIKTMRSFMFQSAALMFLNMIIWDRSDVLLLRYLSHDISQISFFSTAFNLIEKAVLIPQVFGHALGVSMIAEFGHDQQRAAQLAAAAGRYLYLLAGPLLFGMALLSGPIIRLLYGNKYLPAIPVLAIAAGLALFKPLFLPVLYLFRAHNRQAPMLIWNSLSGCANVAIDWLLIPTMGAVGASIGNGLAQALAVVGLWIIARRMFSLKLDFLSIGKITLAILAMSPPVLLLARFLPSYLAIPAGVASGAVVFLGTARLLHVIAGEDVDRLQSFRPSLPGFARPFLDSALRFMAPGSALDRAKGLVSDDHAHTV
jgi:O-antigen/teichoic acid export membrane protein